MKHLFSRYGRNIFQVENNQLVFSKNKISGNIDYLLDNHANQLNQKLFYISSYETNCDFFGELIKCPKNALKICSFDHDFTELTFQDELEASTSVYMMPLVYQNVIATVIKTVSPDAEFLIGKYPNNYDVVLLTWFRNTDFKDLKFLSNNEIIETTLLILFQQMEITSVMNIEPSKTAYGKNISNRFVQNSQDWLREINERKISLSELLKREYNFIYG